MPGRLEMLTYRADPKGPGTFMMVITPGLDLQPLSRNLRLNDQVVLHNVFLLEDPLEPVPLDLELSSLVGVPVLV